MTYPVETLHDLMKVIADVRKNQQIEKVYEQYHILDRPENESVMVC